MFLIDIFKRKGKNWASYQNLLSVEYAFPFSQIIKIKQHAEEIARIDRKKAMYIKVETHQDTPTEVFYMGVAAMALDNGFKEILILTNGEKRKQEIAQYIAQWTQSELITVDVKSNNTSLRPQKTPILIIDEDTMNDKTSIELKKGIKIVLYTKGTDNTTFKYDIDSVLQLN